MSINVAKQFMAEKLIPAKDTKYENDRQRLDIQRAELDSLEIESI